MLVEIVAEENRFKTLVIYKLIEVSICGNTLMLCFCFLEFFFVKVANRNNFTVICRNAIVETAAATKTKNTKFNFITLQCVVSTYFCEVTAIFSASTASFTSPRNFCHSSSCSTKYFGHIFPVTS